jgi:hypothetical protein
VQRATAVTPIRVAPESDRDGLTVKEVQGPARHQDLQTLERYVHLMSGALHSAIARLDLGRQQERGEIRDTPRRIAGSC